MMAAVILYAEKLLEIVHCSISCHQLFPSQQFLDTVIPYVPPPDSEWRTETLQTLTTCTYTPV